MTRWMLVPVAVAFALAPLSAQESAEAVVKKAIEAHGGAETLKKFPAGQATYKGEMSLFGMDLEFTAKLVYQLPDKMRMEIDTEAGGQKLAIVQVVNGDQAVNQVNGANVPLGEAEKKELLQAAIIQDITQLTPLLEGEKYKLSAGQPTEESSVVIVKAEGLTDTKLHFDKKTGLLTRLERKGLAPSMAEPTEVNEVTVMSDFKKFDGVMLPTKITVTHDDKKFMTMTVTDAKLLEKADAGKFAVDD